MHLTIKVVVVALILLVSFAVLVGLMTNWGAESNNMFQGMMEWFNSLLQDPGQLKSDTQKGDNDAGQSQEISNVKTEVVTIPDIKNTK
jgi:predicted PurR-regulated permease PerM